MQAAVPLDIPVGIFLIVFGYFLVDNRLDMLVYGRNHGKTVLGIPGRFFKIIVGI